MTAIIIGSCERAVSSTDMATRCDGAGKSGDAKTRWGVEVIGVVGRSGAGKTTLLERLVPALRAHGIATGCVKHASHGFLADRPGKDSHRLYESGAEAVALISRHQLATFVRRDGHAGIDPSIDDAIAALPRGLELVLAEGFSWEPIPRIAVVPAHEGLAAEYVSGGPLIDVVTAPASCGAFPPAFPAACIAGLARLLAARVRRSVAARARREVFATAPNARDLGRRSRCVSPT